ncbi:protein FAR1-RELATED SEQUENCE 5-like [Arachis duranensis]|uniref:Protein FAR1-RELATED SEQUENCE 5-like n=1 Tax=Arachis duranensis TaxID=130453 RepID=A0A9C6TV42_ARADU|nr:protein FAR1-RELATED SEQUENCE 5-like [Arachis duranensis]
MSSFRPCIGGYSEIKNKEKYEEPIERIHDHCLSSEYVPTGLVLCIVHHPVRRASRLVDLHGKAATRTSSEDSMQPVCAFFPMWTLQDKGVSSVLPPSRTSPSRSNENSSIHQFINENIADHSVIDGEQSNKLYEAMQLSDVIEVGREEMDLGYELQMAHEFYVTYVKKVGFTTKSTNKPINQAIHCNRDGFRESRVKAPTRKNTISAAGCKRQKAAHYHEYRELTTHAKCVIEDNDEAEIRPNKTFLVFANEAGSPSNLGFSEKDLRNYITTRLRTSNVNADVKKMMNYFMRMKDINPNFFYAVKLDEECKFRSAVWVDARGRASYGYYRDVVSVDSTYSTNRSTLLGCALLGNEEIPSYEWVFSQWVKCMGTALQQIITDQCRSIFRAIRNALPDTHHRWCIWHITKKLPHKLGGYRRYRELYDDLNDIV